jgi:hypothetical protein
MLRTLVIVATVAAAALGATRLAHGQPAHTAYTVVLDKSSLVKALDARPKGDSPGDVTVFSASVASAGKTVGRLEATTTAVDPRYQGVAFTMLLDLPRGTLVLQGGGFNRRPRGLTRKGADQLAVTGGTGDYAGAAGVATLTPTGPTTPRLVLSLS